MSKKVRKDKAGNGQRAVLLRRAGVAGGLILALLVALAWYERSQTLPELPQLAEAPPPPLPKLEEPPRGAPPMPTAEQVEAAAAGDASGPGPGPDGAVPELTAAPVVVAPDARQDETPPAASGAPRLVLGAEANAVKGKPSAPPEPDAAAVVAKADVPAAKVAAPAPTPPRTDVEAIKDGYMVQLGVFSAPGNAQALVDRVDAMGIPAHIESRVVVGPFKNRSEADAARRKLSASGLGKGLVVRTR